MNANTESIAFRVNRNDPNLKELILEYPYFPRNADEWEVLGRSIGRNTHLENIEIDFISWVGDENEHVAFVRSFCHGLSQNRYLQRFALRFCDFDLFENGILQQLVPFLEHNQHLRVLDFYFSPIESGGARLLGSTLTRRINKSLEKIVLSGTEMGLDDEGESVNALLTSLKKYTHLKTLELETNEIGQVGCNTISTLLTSTSSKLQKLDLRDSAIDNYKLASLTSSLAKNTVLQELDLGNNFSVTATGWAPLLSLLRSPSCNLKNISLNENNIDYDMTVALVASLADNHTLTKLSLCGNPSITTPGFVAISTLLQIQGTHLEHLDLGENDLDDDVAVALSNSLANNCTLKTLILNDNPSITTTGFVALSAIFQNPDTQLTFLDLTENNINDDSAIAFATSLINNDKLNTLSLGTPPPLTSTGWAAFSRLLCNASSINNTYLSNHTLLSFGYSLRHLPGADKVHLCLELNKRNEGCRSHKIILTHFIGRFSMEPFAKMKVGLLVHVLAWISKLRVECRNGSCCISQSALFHFFRSEPSLFGQLGKINA
mmetsp:Transcript_20925/g.45408  ORF Transcript_20925/g.45408 Transcript_20925/m.45408 type:complete len:548 (-) Transcript_20925:164-1807(-)